VEEPLVVALQLVVQDHAIDSATLLAEALLGTEIGAIDLRVVRQLARLPDALPRTFGEARASVAVFVSVGFEELSPAVRQDNGAVVRTEWRRTEQTLLFEVPLGLT
jgi:hypothetical protein